VAGLTDPKEFVNGLFNNGYNGFPPENQKDFVINHVTAIGNRRAMMLLCRE